MSKPKKIEFAIRTPCLIPCSKCGSTDIYRRFFEKGQDTHTAIGPNRNGHSSPWVDRSDSWVQRASRDVIVHTCRCCGWTWDGDPMGVDTTRSTTDIIETEGTPT